MTKGTRVEWTMVNGEKGRGVICGKVDSTHVLVADLSGGGELRRVFYCAAKFLTKADGHEDASQR